VELAFEKYEGIGNDFLIADDPEAHERLADRALVTRLCDRHRGVGADGILLAGIEGGRPFMRVRNADGSAPQMCGNGLRCVALHLVRTGRVDGAEPFEIDTDAGPHRVHVHEAGDDGRVEVWMRAPSLRPRDLPLASDRPWVDEAIEVAGRLVRATAVSMGNPHVVLFEETGERDVLGPALERDPRFPERVNVGFARRTSDGIDLAVWERGVGWTMACGTGACAAAVAAVETGRARRGRELAVRLPGGELTIVVGGEHDRVRMTGPARHVFSGRVAI
jgi:diaminopimelate epimerase